MQIFVNPNYDFVKYRFHALAFSILFFLTGMFFLAQRGLNFGIDFAGGANIILRFADAVPIDKLRSVLKDATIQQYGKTAENSVLIRLPEQQKEGDYASNVVKAIYAMENGPATGKIDLNFSGRDAIAEMLKATDPDRKGTGIDAHDYYYGIGKNIMARRSELGLFHNFSEVTSAPGVTSGISNALSQQTFLGKFTVLNQETVGPQVGRELQQKAIWAVILSTLAMGAYIWIRFDFKFGAGAIVCLIHDVSVAFAFLCMIHAEISLIMVAAFLMIVGYSVNDTVVTYDRVRENQKKLKVKGTFGDILNLSINQTLSRTILTSGTVILVLIALIIFGGKVIHDFSWVLLIGTVAGTYSTIFIVPVFVIWYNNHFSGEKRTVPARVEASGAPVGAKKARG
jgi:preprotein translocase subunit SecF